MAGRWEPPRRRYTELCNRSGSGSPGLAVLRPLCAQACDESLEDHWEDSSVSIRRSCSWEPSSGAWLDASGFSPPLHLGNGEGRASDDRISCPSRPSSWEPSSSSRLNASGFSPPLHPGNGEGRASDDPISRRSRPSRYLSDAGDHFGSASKGRRCFPPPMASCCTLSIKEGGRFILKEMDADHPHGFLRAQRENGRLLLQFVLSEESSDEIAALEGDGNEVSVVDDGIIGEDEDEVSAVGRLEGPVASISGESFDFQDAAQHLYEGVRKGNSDCLFAGEDVTTIIGGDVLAAASKEIEWVQVLPQCEGFCNDHEDPTLKPSDETAFPARQDVCKEGGTWLSGAVDGNQIVAENGPGLDQQHVTGLREQECLWDVDVASHILPNLSSCSPNQIYLHPPLMKIPTVCGLAMS